MFFAVFYPFPIRSNVKNKFNFLINGMVEPVETFRANSSANFERVYQFLLKSLFFHIWYRCSTLIVISAPRVIFLPSFSHF